MLVEIDKGTSGESEQWSILECMQRLARATVVGWKPGMPTTHPDTG